MTDQYGRADECKGVGPDEILDKIRQFNRAVLNPIIARIAGRVPGMLIILSHQGRNSGRRYRAPVAAQVTDKRVLIPLTYGDRADWVKNVLHADRAVILHQGTVIKVVHPRIVGRGQALSEFPILLQLIMRGIGMRSFMAFQRLESEIDDASKRAGLPNGPAVPARVHVTT